MSLKVKEGGEKNQKKTNQRAREGSPKPNS